MVPCDVGGKPHTLKRLVIEPTYACNLRCTHCYVYRSARAVRRAAHLQDSRPVCFWQGVLHSAPDGIGVHFTGGELFVYSGVFELLESAGSRFPFSLSTNATLLNPTACNRLAELAPHHVTVSILGNEPVHDAITGVAGSFCRTVKAIEDLTQRLPSGRVSVNFVLLPENASAVVDVIKFVEGFDVSGMVIQLFDPALNRCGIVAGVENIPPPRALDWSGVDLDHVAQILERVRRRAISDLPVLLASSMTPTEIVNYLSGVFDTDEWKCSDVFDTMRCSPTGKVYTCNGLEIGDLGQRSVLELWHSERFTTFREARSSTVLEPGCEGCCKIRRKR